MNQSTNSTEPTDPNEITIAELRAEIYTLKEALVWCSGSKDFARGGVAHTGWKKLCKPLITNHTPVSVFEKPLPASRKVKT